MKIILTALLAAFAGIAIALLATQHSAAQPAPAKFKFPPQAQLQRFEVIAGKEDKFKEWMDYLRQHRTLAVATLADERMYFETVLTEKIEGVTYAYWLSFKGEGGKPVESSNHELDKVHLAYWNECIKKGSRQVLNTEFYLTPTFIDAAIARQQLKQ